METNVVVSQAEKCLSEGERGSAAYDLLLQPNNTHTQSCIRGNRRTHISVPRCGNVVDSFCWRAAGVWSGCCRDVWSWGAEALSSSVAQQGQEWQTSPQLLWWGGRHSSPAWDRDRRKGYSNVPHVQNYRNRHVRDKNQWYPVMGIHKSINYHILILWENENEITMWSVLFSHITLKPTETTMPSDYEGRGVADN